MNKKIPQKIKCPKCKNEGYTYLEEGRYYFNCSFCLYNTLLKLLNSKKTS